MVALKIRKIVFGEPNMYHFVSFNSGEHETSIIDDRHDIDIEVKGLAAQIWKCDITLFEIDFMEIT